MPQETLSAVPQEVHRAILPAQKNYSFGLRLDAGSKNFLGGYWLL